MFFWFFHKFKTFNDLIQYVNTPEKLEWWELFNFRWVSDNEQFGADRVRSPEQMLIDDKWYGCGDCDDFSRFNYEILKQLGFQPVVFNVYNKNKGHSICVFRHRKNKFYVFNNTDLWNLKTESLVYEAIAKYIYSDWTKLEEIDEEGNVSVIIRNEENKKNV